MDGVPQFREFPHAETPGNVYSFGVVIGSQTWPPGIINAFTCSWNICILSGPGTPACQGEISFEAIEALRQKLCPSASQQSALLGITQLWTAPCILVEARLAHKVGEFDPGQGSFDFKKVPPPVLRAVHAKPNDVARKMGIRVIPNFRVPSNSVIYRVFHEEISYSESREDLSDWRSSSGACWTEYPVLVKAKRFGDSVQALIIPILRAK